MWASSALTFSDEYEKWGFLSQQQDSFLWAEFKIYSALSLFETSTKLNFLYWTHPLPALDMDCGHINRNRYHTRSFRFDLTIIRTTRPLFFFRFNMTPLCPLLSLWEWVMIVHITPCCLPFDCSISVGRQLCPTNQIGSLLVSFFFLFESSTQLFHY